MATKSLLPKTIAMLREHKRYRDISEATGLDYNWLLALSGGRIVDPGILKIEKLHGFLASQSAAAE